MTGIVGLPDLTLEINPTGDTWVDITSDLRLGDGLSCFRGRTDAQSGPQAGTMSFTLNNPNANYTPGRTGGAYHPLKARCPVRLSITNGATRPLWTGAVDSWKVRMVNGVRPVATVQASDNLVRFQGKVLKRWETECHLSTSPIFLWPLTEPAGSVAGSTVGNGSYDSIMVATGDPSFGVGTLPVDEGSTCSIVTGSLAATLNSVGSVSGLALSVLHKSSSATTHTLSVGLGGPVFTLSINATTVTMSAPDGSTLTHTVSLNDGVWHQVGASYGNQKIGMSGGLPLYGEMVGLYVDGALVESGTPAATLLPPTVMNVTPWNGQLSHVGMWTGQINAAAIMSAAHAALGAAGDTTTARFARLAAMGGTTAASVTAGLSTMCVQPILGVTLLDAMARCGDAELSGVDIDAAGLPRLPGRSTVWNKSAGLALTANDISPETEFEQTAHVLVNDVTGSRPDGPDFYSVDQDSSDTYGPQTATPDLLLDSDAQLESAVHWLAHSESVPEWKTTELTVDVWAKQSSVSLNNVIDLEPGDIVEVSGLPAQLPAGTVALVAQGFSDSFSTAGWSRRINTTPAKFRSVWVLGDPVYSVLGTTTVMGI